MTGFVVQRHILKWWCQVTTHHITLIYTMVVIEYYFDVPCYLQCMIRHGISNNTMVKVQQTLSSLLLERSSAEIYSDIELLNNRK